MSFIIFGRILWFFFTQTLSEEACVPLVCSPTRWLFCQKSNKVKSLIFLAPLHCIVRLHTTYYSQSHQRGSISSTYLHTVLLMKTNVLLIPYFCLLVFGILVTLVAWFSFLFFHLALQNVNKDYVIFLYFCNFVAKVTKNQKPKNEMNKKNIS